MVFHLLLLWLFVCGSDHRTAFSRVFVFGFPLEARHSPRQGQMHWSYGSLRDTVPASSTVVSAYFVARVDCLFCLVHPAYLAYHS